MKTFGKTRRDPQKGKKEFSTHKGFTIIELMVVIAVIAIITSFALPSYRTLIEKRQRNQWCAADLRISERCKDGSHQA